MTKELSIMIESVCAKCTAKVKIPANADVSINSRKCLRQELAGTIYQKYIPAETCPRERARVSVPG